MRRVLVIGCSGAGKSTLSMRLSRTLQLPLIGLDRYYWKPGWQPSSSGEWRQRVAKLAEGEAWIMDGNFSETFDLRMPRADTLVWLDFQRRVCLRRVLTRALFERHGDRPDLPAGCPEQIDWNLLRWVWRFDAEQRPAITPAIERFGAHLQVERSRDDRAVAAFASRVGLN